MWCHDMIYVLKFPVGSRDSHANLGYLDHSLIQPLILRFLLSLCRDILGVAPGILCIQRVILPVCSMQMFIFLCHHLWHTMAT